uniref:Uncharacterized protein n=1 Tax=Romanomermis culicivorax TaxID=13658 RepID=A0A915I749_ROMCU
MDFNEHLIEAMSLKLSTIPQIQSSETSSMAHILFMSKSRNNRPNESSKKLDNNLKLDQLDEVHSRSAQRFSTELPSFASLFARLVAFDGGGFNEAVDNFVVGGFTIFWLRIFTLMHAELYKNYTEGYDNL